MRHLERELDLSPERSRVVLQGFGNASYHCARLLHGDGYRIVGLSDSQGAIYDADGMDPLAVMAHKRETGSLAGAPSSGTLREMDNAALLQAECDVLVPAAMENQIILENAPDIAARVVLELANGPVTPAADKVLGERGVTVIPDILANAGGVTVSYFEWVQNKAGYYWDADEVQGRLRSIMERESRRVWDAAGKRGLDLCTAAYVHALERIAVASKPTAPRPTSPAEGNPVGAALGRHAKSVPCAAALSALVVALGAETAAAPDSQPDAKPLFELGVAGGGGYLPDYPAAGQSHFQGLVLPYLAYRGAIVRSDEKGILRGRIVRSDRFELDLSLAGSFAAESDDNDARRGLPDLDYLGEVGPRLQITLARAARDAKIELELPVRAVLSTDFSDLRPAGCWRRPRSPTSTTVSGAAALK